MSKKIIFIHGMFQNPRSWEKWLNHFTNHGYECLAPAWPLHDGDPQLLRANPPAGLGELRLKTVIDAMMDVVGASKPVVIGHSVGGLIAQILLNKGLVSAAVALSSVAPNGMIDFDFSSLKNIAVIVNPLKGDEPICMDAETFHGAFANTLSKNAAEIEFEHAATHDSRNVLRDCMGDDGKLDLNKPHAPLLLIGGEKDEIIPQHLTEKNAKAYEKAKGVVLFKPFAGRSHYICNEPGWEEVCRFSFNWVEQNLAANELCATRAA